MRKNSPRKWLHAVLDLLPVILIPVFMIYSHRHEINDGSIQVQEKIAVDFNQKIIDGNFETSTPTFGYWSYGTNTTFVIEDNIATATVINNSHQGNKYINYAYSTQLYANHHYYVQFQASQDFGTLYVRLYQQSPFQYITGINFSPTSTLSYYNGIIVNNLTTNTGRLFFTFDGANSTYLSLANVNLIDLTQMYGEGNEPTASEFHAIFQNSFYDYVVSDKQLIDGDLVTYDDTDIMSQMTYQLYNSVDKYFNMGNVFNLNGVYDWFNLNIFNGTAPVYVYIVWQIVLYEFVMDLLFLLYGLFMWFIDMVEHLMEKPFKSIK